MGRIHGGPSARTGRSAPIGGVPAFGRCGHGSPRRDQHGLPHSFKSVRVEARLRDPVRTILRYGPDHSRNQRDASKMKLSDGFDWVNRVFLCLVNHSCCRNSENLYAKVIVPLHFFLLPKSTGLYMVWHRQLSMSSYYRLGEELQKNVTG